MAAVNTQNTYLPSDILLSMASTALMATSSSSISKGLIEGRSVKNNVAKQGLE